MTEETLVLPVVRGQRAVHAPRHGGTLLLADVRLRRSGPADPLGAAPTETLAEHRERLGERPRGAADLLTAVEASGLTGHGGAHVPAGLKWRAALRGSGPLTVVANGAESEPVAGKDGTLLRQRPHLVLDGLALLAESLGARRAVLWLHGDDDGARRAVEGALAERRTGVRGGAPSAGPHVEVVSGPSHYLAGESSAIVQALSGGPALPTVRRRATDPAAPRTLVHNVETLARLALLARGQAPPATRLLTVLARTPDRGRFVVEIPLATTLRQVLDGLGEPPHPQAVLLGGYGGAWASWDAVADVPVAEDALRAVGARLGAGVVVPLGADACGVRRTAALLGYLAARSARQCGPCLFGLPALAGSVADLADGSGGRALVTRLLADAGAIAGRGACHHPDGATGLVASAVEVFRADVEDHAAGRDCRRPAGPALPGLTG